MNEEIEDVPSGIFRLIGVGRNAVFLSVPAVLLLAPRIGDRKGQPTGVFLRKSRNKYKKKKGEIMASIC